MIDRLFYIIYNSYYKHGTFKNDIPPLTVFGIFCAGIFSLSLSVIVGYYFVQDAYYFRHNPFFSWTKSLMVFSAAITYFLFYFRKRYKTIYLKFKDNPIYDDRKTKILAFATMIFIICSPIIEIFLVNKLIIDR